MVWGRGYQRLVSAPLHQQHITEKILIASILFLTANFQQYIELLTDKIKFRPHFFFHFRSIFCQINITIEKIFRFMKSVICSNWLNTAIHNTIKILLKYYNHLVIANHWIRYTALRVLQQFLYILQPLKWSLLHYLWINYYNILLCVLLILYNEKTDIVYETITPILMFPVFPQTCLICKK